MTVEEHAARIIDEAAFAPGALLTDQIREVHQASARDRARRVLALVTDDRDEFRDLLHDLVMLDGEELAIGGGPGFKERRDKAWAAAREKFEP